MMMMKLTLSEELGKIGSLNRRLQAMDSAPRRKRDMKKVPGIPTVETSVMKDECSQTLSSNGD